jgi:Fe2+ transport system protein FeoA
MNVLFQELRAGESAIILGFNTTSIAYKQRLLEMGLTPKTKFTVIRVAPLGDPVQIRVHNTSLCLRRKEACILQLERC